VSEYTVKPLGPDTWDDFARMAERHNGVWGGCWCTWFHPDCPEKKQGGEATRALKQRLVTSGEAHAALVFDGDAAVGWCQYGSPEELPKIYHRKEYEAGLERAPDFRITCFFVDRDYPAPRCLRDRTARRARPDRRGRRRGRRGLPARHGGRQEVGVVPLQRHADALREGRLRVPAAQGPGQLRDGHDGLNDEGRPEGLPRPALRC
jgi:hypothetical protein